MTSTDIILEHFRKITQIPRCSGNEAGIRAWLVKWAKKHSFQHQIDRIGNIVIRVPASKNAKNAATTVILQGHLDMVCEKKPELVHDFTKDPLELQINGDWLSAVKTTLGADNGIAIAIAIALAEDKNITHPPLELLFTVDEETGLTGATNLELPLVGRKLINIDSEEEGVLTVGCAGGIESELRLPITRTSYSEAKERADIVVFGLSGGHSGVDIHTMRANAIRLLARTLQTLVEKADVRLVGLNGGSAHNAIPRDAKATIAFQKKDQKYIEKTISTLFSVFKKEFTQTDPFLRISFNKNSVEGICLSKNATERAADFLMAIPHGVAAMSTDIVGLVETSNNEATARLEDDDLVVTTSQRSNIVSRLHTHTRRITGITRLAGGRAHVHGGYSPWQPNMNSALLAQAKRLYKARFGKKPLVEAIHAGLECGIIGAKYEGMDMLSLGPTIQNPHSPDERLQISTLEPIYNLLIDLLAENSL